MILKTDTGSRIETADKLAEHLLRTSIPEITKTLGEIQTDIKYMATKEYVLEQIASAKKDSTIPKPIKEEFEKHLKEFHKKNTPLSIPAPNNLESKFLRDNWKTIALMITFIILGVIGWID